MDGLSQHKFQKSSHTHTRRRETSYDVARLLLMVPSEPWENSILFFGAAAFCTTKIDDFRVSSTLSSMTTWLTHSSKRRLLSCTSSKRQIVDIIQVDQLGGTVPTFKMHNVGTVPTFKMHNIGTVPTYKMHNVGTVPTFKMHNVGTPKLFKFFLT